MQNAYHFDLRNPIWEATREYKPVFQRERITEVIQDANANELKIEVEYHYYRHDCKSRVVFCIVKTGSYPTEFDRDSIKESVVNIVDFFEGYSSLFECEVQILNPIK
jgi:hypothetical protein